MSARQSEAWTSWASGWFHDEPVLSLARPVPSGQTQLSILYQGGGYSAERRLSQFFVTPPRQVLDMHWSPSRLGGLAVLTENEIIVYDPSSTEVSSSFAWQETHRILLPERGHLVRWVGALSGSLLVSFSSRLEIWTRGGQHGYVQPSVIKEVLATRPSSLVSSSSSASSPPSEPRVVPSSPSIPKLMQVNKHQQRRLAIETSFTSGLLKYSERRASSLAKFYCTWIHVYDKFDKSNEKVNADISKHNGGTFDASFSIRGDLLAVVYANAVLWFRRSDQWRGQHGASDGIGNTAGTMAGSSYMKYKLLRPYCNKDAADGMFRRVVWCLSPFVAKGELSANSHVGSSVCILYGAKGSPLLYVFKDNSLERDCGKSDDIGMCLLGKIDVSKHCNTMKFEKGVTSIVKVLILRGSQRPQANCKKRADCRGPHPDSRAQCGLVHWASVTGPMTGEERQSNSEYNKVSIAVCLNSNAIMFFEMTLSESFADVALLNGESSAVNGFDFISTSDAAEMAVITKTKEAVARMTGSGDSPNRDEPSCVGSVSIFGTSGLRLDHPCILLSIHVMLRTMFLREISLQAQKRKAVKALTEVDKLFQRSMKAALTTATNTESLSAEERGSCLSWWHRVLPIVNEPPPVKDEFGLRKSFAGLLKQSRVPHEFASITTSEKILLAALAEVIGTEDLTVFDQSDANAFDSDTNSNNFSPQTVQATTTTTTVSENEADHVKNFVGHSMRYGGSAGTALFSKPHTASSLFETRSNASGKHNGSAAASLFSKPGTANALFESRSSASGKHNSSHEYTNQNYAGTKVFTKEPHRVTELALWLPQFYISLISKIDPVNILSFPVSIAAWISITCSLETRQQFFRRLLQKNASSRAECVPARSEIWPLFRSVRAALWLTDSSSMTFSLPLIREVLLDEAKATFRLQKNPDCVALTYIVLDKIRVLSAMYKSCGNRRVSNFLAEYCLSANFEHETSMETPKGSTQLILSRQALKNASALMRSGRPHLAAGFFLLARPPKVREALNLICSWPAEYTGGRKRKSDNLSTGDLDLGLVVAYLYDIKENSRPYSESSHTNYVLERWFSKNREGKKAKDLGSASSTILEALIHFHQGKLENAIELLTVFTSPSESSSASYPDCPSRLSVSSLASSSPLSLGSSVNAVSLAKAIITRAVLPGLLDALCEKNNQSKNVTSIHPSQSSLSAVTSLLEDFKSSGAGQAVLIIASTLSASNGIPKLNLSSGPRYQFLAYEEAVSIASRIVIRQMILPSVQKHENEPKMSNFFSLSSMEFVNDLLHQLAQKLSYISPIAGGQTKKESAIIYDICDDILGFIDSGRVRPRKKTTSLVVDALNVKMRFMLSVRYDLYAMILLCGNPEHLEPRLRSLLNAIELRSLELCAFLREEYEYGRNYQLSGKPQSHGKEGSLSDDTIETSLLHHSLYCNLVARLLWGKCESNDFPHHMLKCAYLASQSSRVCIFSSICALSKKRQTQFDSLYEILSSFLGAAAATVTDRTLASDNLASSPSKGTYVAPDIAASATQSRGVAKRIDFDINIRLRPSFLDMSVCALVQDTITLSHSKTRPEGYNPITTSTHALFSDIVAASALSRYADLEKNAYYSSKVMQNHLQPWCANLRTSLQRFIECAMDGTSTKFVHDLAQITRNILAEPWKSETRRNIQKTATSAARADFSTHGRDFRDILTFIRLKECLLQHSETVCVNINKSQKYFAENSLSFSTNHLETKNSLPSDSTINQEEKGSSFISDLGDSLITAVSGILNVPQPPSANNGVARQVSKLQVQHDAKYRVESVDTCSEDLESKNKEEVSEHTTESGEQKKIKTGLRDRLSRKFTSQKLKLQRSAGKRRQRQALRKEAAAKEAKLAMSELHHTKYFYTMEAMKWIVSNYSLVETRSQNKGAFVDEMSQEMQLGAAKTVMSRLSQLGLIEMGAPTFILKQLKMSTDDVFREVKPRKAFVCNVNIVERAIRFPLSPRFPSSVASREDYFSSDFSVWKSSSSASAFSGEVFVDDGISCIFTAAPHLLQALFRNESVIDRLWSTAHTSSYLFSLLTLPGKGIHATTHSVDSDEHQFPTLELCWRCTRRVLDASDPTAKGGFVKQPHDTSDENISTKNGRKYKHLPQHGLVGAALHMGLLRSFGFHSHRVVWQIRLEFLDASFKVPDSNASVGEASFSILAALKRSHGNIGCGSCVAIKSGKDNCEDYCSEELDVSMSEDQQARSKDYCTYVKKGHYERGSPRSNETNGDIDSANGVVIFHIPIPSADSFQEALSWWSGEAGLVKGGADSLGSCYPVAPPPTTLSVDVVSKTGPSRDYLYGSFSMGLNKLRLMPPVMSELSEEHKSLRSLVHWPSVVEDNVELGHPGEDTETMTGSVHIRVSQCVLIVSGSPPIRSISEIEKGHSSPKKITECNAPVNLTGLRPGSSLSTITCTFGKSVTRLGIVLQPLICKGAKLGCYIEKVHPGTVAEEEGLRSGMTLEQLNGNNASRIAFSDILIEMRKRPVITAWKQSFSTRNLPH